MSNTHNTAGAELAAHLADFLKWKMAEGCTAEQAANHLVEHLRQMAAEQEAWNDMMAELGE